MPRTTKNALTSGYNDNYFEEVQNTIVANKVRSPVRQSNYFGPQGINVF